MPNKKHYGRIYVVSGPSGAGKTTLIKILRLRGEFRKSLVRVATVTTRKPRRSERSGRDYHFLEKEEFLRRLHNAEFIESQEIFGHYYAVPKAGLLEVIKSGKDALLCIDVKGALTIKRLFPKESVLIFIAAPDLSSLKERLRQRSSGDKAELEERLKVSKEEMGYIKYYDYLVINDMLPGALYRLSAVIIAERQKVHKGDAR